MTTNEFDRPHFDAGRMPLQDGAAEAARVTAYWKWLTENAGAILDASEKVDDAPNGGSWRRLTTAGDGDYEAKHMDHSIGHSWTKYSAIGDLFSLRSADNIPQATVLVQERDGRRVAIHAREHENARLSDENKAALEAFGRSNGFDTPDVDALAFDAFTDEVSPNTRFKYLLRADYGSKSIGTVVLGGRLSVDQIDMMRGSLKGGRRFNPFPLGIFPLGPEHAGDHTGDHVDHEVLSVCHVTDEPTGTLTAGEFHDAWMKSALLDWPDILGVTEDQEESRCHPGPGMF